MDRARDTQRGGRFVGRTAIVTGASSGIGLAVARRLDSEGALLTLVAAPEDAAELKRVALDLGGTDRPVQTLAADIGEQATADQAVEAALGQWGRLDLLVSNAGIARFGEILHTPIEDLDVQLRVNVRGMFLMVLAAARAMAREGGGRIVCTCSSSGTLGDAYQAPYNMSKAAVAQLVRSFAVDLAPHGVRVNGVAPGWTRTAATQALLDDPAAWAKHRTRVPLDRPADPEEVAGVATFLLSDDATYMTGAVVPVDGGLTAGIRLSGWDPVIQDAAI